MTEITIDDIAAMLDEARKEIEMPGLESPEHAAVLCKQIFDSVKRVKYLQIIAERGCSRNRVDPSCDQFDPLRGAIYYLNQGDVNEASWLIFLYIVFGKDRKGHYGLLKAFYSGLNEGQTFTYEFVLLNVDFVINWIEQNENKLKDAGSFGNHRKYESLKNTSRGVGNTIRSYIELVGESHKDFFDRIVPDRGLTSGEKFEILYRKFSSIKRFGRLSNFDFVTMLGKVGIVNAEPDNAYISSSTGPKAGVERLFNIYGMPNKNLEDIVIEMGKYFDFPFKMQVLEDSLCNWQKSPAHYRKFKG